MTSLAALADEMRTKGAFPAWSPRMIMRLGDDLRDHAALTPVGDNVVEACRELVLISYDADIPPDIAWVLLNARIGVMAQSLDEIRTVLINFGALDQEDDVTSPVSLLEALLPPQGEGG